MGEEERDVEWGEKEEEGEEVRLLMLGPWYRSSPLATNESTFVDD